MMSIYVSDFEQASISHGIFIVIIGFIISFIYACLLNHFYNFGLVSWAVIDLCWIVSSLCAFLISVWVISTEISRSEAFRWKMTVLDKQESLSREISVFRSTYCNSYVDSREYNLVEICKNISNLERRVENNVAEVRIPGFSITVSANYPMPKLIEASPSIASVQWSRIISLVQLSNTEIRRYNANRPRAQRGQSARLVRAIWIWLFPIAAGFRLSRSWSQIFERRIRITNFRAGLPDPASEEMPH